MRMHNKSSILAILAGVTLCAAQPVHAADKFKVTSVDCEMFWLWKHTPVIHYDIVDERKVDYQTNPDSGYFQQAAQRTAEFCDRTSFKPQEALQPPRKIRGIWFESNDGRFKVLYDLAMNGVDVSANIINRIGDEYVTRQRADAQHEAQLEAVRTRDARAREIKAAEDKAAQDKIDADNAREKLFFARKDLQISRLGAEVVPLNFTSAQDVRTNPFHFRKLGLAVVRTQFNKMVSDKIALFGNEMAPILVHIDDVDRFIKSGETVMLALKVIERGDVERSYGTLPEIILSMMKAEPIFGDYVGAYTCPENDCLHVFDPPPPM